MKKMTYFFPILFFIFNCQSKVENTTILSETKDNNNEKNIKQTK